MNIIASWSISQCSGTHKAHDHIFFSWSVIYVMHCICHIMHIACRTSGPRCIGFYEEKNGRGMLHHMDGEWERYVYSVAGWGVNRLQKYFYCPAETFVQLSFDSPTIKDPISPDIRLFSAVTLVRCVLKTFHRFDRKLANRWQVAEWGTVLGFKFRKKVLCLFK